MRPPQSVNMSVSFPLSCQGGGNRLATFSRVLLLYYLGLFCLLLPGCVSEQWVRGYVRHELAGVKDTVAEEVYPTEKALTDVKTQMATITVEQKRIADELQAMRATVPSEDKKLAELSQRVAKLAFDLNMLEGLVENLLKPRPEPINVQTGTGTTGKALNPTSGVPGTTTETLMEKSKAMDKVRER